MEFRNSRGATDRHVFFIVIYTDDLIVCMMLMLIMIIRVLVFTILAMANNSKQGSSLERSSQKEKLETKEIHESSQQPQQIGKRAV